MSISLLKIGEKKNATVLYDKIKNKPDNETTRIYYRKFTSPTFTHTNSIFYCNNNKELELPSGHDSKPCHLIGLFVNVNGPISTNKVLSVGTYSYIDVHCNQFHPLDTMEVLPNNRARNLLKTEKVFGSFRTSKMYRENEEIFRGLRVTDVDLAELKRSITTDNDLIEFRPNSKFYEILSEYSIVDVNYRTKDELVNLGEGVVSVPKKIIVDFLIPTIHALLDDPFNRLCFIFESNGLDTTYEMKFDFHAFFYYDEVVVESSIKI